MIEDDGDRLAAVRRVSDVAAWLGRHKVDACHMVQISAAMPSSS